MRDFKTPKIPNRIKTLSCVGYTNIFELGLGNQNLFGTETLMGDWEGPLLVVAKDFAPVEQIRKLMSRGVSPNLVYHHNDGDGRYQTGLKTNSRLLKFLYGASSHGMLSGNRNLDCGALYISACFFLKDGNDGSSNLTGWRPGKEVFEKSGEVFRFALSHMPNLRAIACLGVDAERLVRVNVNHDSGMILGKLRHPSRGSDKTLYSEWHTFLTEAGLYVDRTGVVRGGAR